MLRVVKDQHFTVFTKSENNIFRQMVKAGINELRKVTIYSKYI